MLGTIVNTGTILVGSVAGSVLKKGIGEKYENAMFQACGLAAFGIGINAVVSNMPKSEYPVLFIVSRRFFPPQRKCRTVKVTVRCFG